ncbi:hypothetical protein G7074_17080 [Pedobacter sp. HDW13]|uniref:hypothetical protein n=1 Tax=unclassified Pedobacter TaxID=2628915 RepID=UPI000F59B73B|nr:MULTISPECIES: hypothetical protein [unclassified Pedobacter]QIL40824.1 hypothetical protein G7074_17080 [Pedobacter sp. HDW13]RQO71365.1 hypothetical protein DBR40_16250 [Pedobacter sp. KBW01]
MKLDKYLVISFLLTFIFACNSNKIAKKEGQQKSVKNAESKVQKDSTTTNAVHFPILDSLKTLLSIADTTKSESIADDTSGHDINDLIIHELTRVLINPKVTNEMLDSLHTSLGVIRSDDKRFWIFNWYENTGGTFKSNISVLYYRTASGKQIIKTSQDVNNNFPSSGAWFNMIYKLPVKNKELYLCLGDGVGCTTCIYSTAVVVEVKKDSINFNYPAFEDNEGYDHGDHSSSALVLTARMGDIEKFEYNPKNRTLYFTYLTDDNTPIVRARKEKQKTIIRKLFFNGKKFIGNPYE